MNSAFLINGPTQKIATATSSAATQLNGVGGFMEQVELNNQSAIEIRVEFGPSTVVASLTTSYPIHPGQCKVLTVPPAATHIATISASGTPNLDVTPGKGL